MKIKLTKNVKREPRFKRLCEASSPAHHFAKHFVEPEKNEQHQTCASHKRNRNQRQSDEARPIKGRPILLVRKGNQIFGVSNRCPHMGCTFEGGILRDYLIMCPCHGWKFDIRNGKYEENEATTLETYRCIIENGKVHVEIKNK